MGTTLDSVEITGNRKGQPNYPKEFKRQVAIAACEPGISVAKLGMPHKLNVNIAFRWRRELQEREAGPSVADAATYRTGATRGAALATDDRAIDQHVTCHRGGDGRRQHKQHRHP